MAFYKDNYDVIVIGGALAGMSCAMRLASEGKSVLVLERHNLPGGVATSFVRSGIEMEATLHEMMSLGPVEDPLYIRKYLDEMKVAIDWLRVPEAYELYSPEDNIDPHQALMIGQELMKSLYPNYQYVIATHNDRKHIHNHIYCLFYSL